MPAEAGAEASGCPGTASAVKAPLNRAEQEGALGRRPGAEEVSPRLAMAVSALSSRPLP